MITLDQILKQVSTQSDAANPTFALTEDWLQGRTLFGGLIAALANFAMRRRVAADRPLRALQVVFIGPNAPGQVEFQPEISREGKAVTLASCTVRSGGEISATVTAMYGVARASQLKIVPAAAALQVGPEQVQDVPRRPGLGFTQHYQQRWARGSAPFSGALDSAMSVYVRCRGEESSRTSESHALALMDAIPTPALALMTTQSPASTLSWTLEILDPHFEFDIDGWWRLDASVDAALDGYVVHSGHVVNPEGRVAAISRQVVVVYA